MIKINKKLISSSILIFALFLLLSTIAHAKPFTDAFRGGLIDINNFFTGEQYKSYATAIDFFFFSFLFIAIYMMGARYAFKEVKRPEQVIVILLGLMTAFLLVLGGFSATILLPYIQWLLYILLFILYWWLLKGIKSKFWRFILALLLTLLTIGLLQGLFAAIAPEAEIPAFFKDLGAAFRGIQFPELPGPPGVPPALRDLFGPPTVVTPTPPTTLPPTVVTPTPPEEKPFNWMWVIIPLLILVALGGGILGYKNREKLKGWFRRRPPTAAEERAAEEREEEITIQRIINEIVKIIKLKRSILEVIDGVVNYKNAKIKDLHDLYLKVLKYDKPFWVDPDSDAFKNFLEQKKEVGAILNLEFELERELIKLMEKENEITGLGKYEGKEFWQLGMGLKYIKIGLAGSWLKYIIEKDKERAKQLIEEINRIEREDPLLFWEKAMDAMRRWLVSLRSYPESAPAWYQNIMATIYGIFMRLMNKSEGATLGLCWNVKAKIAQYFIIGKSEGYRLRAWEKLTDIKRLKKWYRDKSKWKAIEKVNPESIKRHFEKEQKFFNEEFKPALLKQMKYMYLLIRYLKLSEAKREEFTEMQELKVDLLDPVGNNVTLTKEQAADPTNAIPRDRFVRVFTRLATGKGPFTLVCHIGGKRVTIREHIQKTEDHPLFEFTSEELGNNLIDGENVITFYLISETLAPETPQTPIAQKYRDVKSIKVMIGPIRLIQLPRNLMDAVNRERTLLKIIANSIGKLIERMPRRRKEIDEEGIADIEETARRTAQELEEFQDKEIFEKYPRETLHEKSKRINRKVRVIVRFIGIKIKKEGFIKTAKILLKLEEERLRALGEVPPPAGIEVPEEVTPPPEYESFVGQKPTGGQAPTLIEQIKNDIIQLHNSRDFGTLKSRYPVEILGLENIDEMIENPDGTPIFVPKQAGSYFLIDTRNDRGFVVPKTSVFSKDEVKYGAAEYIFELKGYKRGHIYRRIQVIEPAIFEFVGEKWRIFKKGILELGAEEPEA